MVNLASGLMSKGYSVELFIYHSNIDFFRKEIESNKIVIHELKDNHFRWVNVIWKISRLYRNNNYDSVISFMDGPNLLAEVSQIIAFKKMRLIISERKSFQMESSSIWFLFLRICHLLADYVVANSHSHSKWLRNKKWIKNKVYTIYNGYPLDAINSVQILNRSDTSSKLKFLVLARIDSGKNGLRLLKAFIRFYHLHGFSPSLSWAGLQEKDPMSLYDRKLMDTLLIDHPEVGRKWRFLGVINDTKKLLQEADALIHVSLYEGLPNAICESFISACPVIASNVCDHPILVEDGVRGFLCNPLSIDSICLALERFTMLSAQDRNKMGLNARAYAESNLSIDKMVSEYEALINSN